MTDEQFLVLEECLQSFQEFFQQVLGILYVVQPPHTNNDLVKFLRPNRRLREADLLKWRLDPGHGLLHGLITAYFAVKLANGWRIPPLRDNIEQQRLIASCLVHDYAKVANGGEPHDRALGEFFSLLLPAAYTHSDRTTDTPLVQADRIEGLRHEEPAPRDVTRLLDHVPHEHASFEVWAFHEFVRPALSRLFAGRTEVWLRHGAEEADWRQRWPDQPMVSRSKDWWPNFYYPWPNLPEYWAIEVGELTPGLNKPQLVDYYFPSGLMTIADYRATEAAASIVSAPGREHELAYGKIPLRKWIFVFQDNQLRQDRYLVTDSGGFVTFPILTSVLEVADTLYSKLHSIG